MICFFYNLFQPNSTWTISRQHKNFSHFLWLFDRCHCVNVSGTHQLRLCHWMQSQVYHYHCGSAVTSLSLCLCQWHSPTFPEELSSGAELRPSVALSPLSVGPGSATSTVFASFISKYSMCEHCFTSEYSMCEHCFCLFYISIQYVRILSLLLL